MKKIIELYKKYEEIINYLIVGVLTTIVSVGVKWGLLFTVLSAKNPKQLQIAIIISWLCAVTFAYITNRIFVFKSKNKNILKEIISFFGARVLTLVIEAFIMWFFITLLKLDTNMWVLIWTMVTQVVVTILNYIFSKLLVFCKKESKSNKKELLRKFYLGLGIVFGTILIGLLLMIATYLIPNNRVQKNIENSISCFNSKSNWPVLLEDYSSTTLDNYTDAIILNELYYTNKEQSVIEKSLRVYGNYSGEDPVKSLKKNISKTSKEKTTAYERYWHGNLFVIKILMIFLDYRAIKIVNMFAIGILIYFICKWMRIRKREKFIMPFLLSILFINPFIISMSFQFCAVFYIMLLGVLGLLKYKEKIEKRKLYPYYFLFIGMITSFFDFLTYPLATLGVLLAFYIMLDDRTQKKKEYWFDIIKSIILYSFLWAIGYGIMWASKWIISSIVFHENLVKDALNQILFRTDTAINFTRLDAIEKNVKVFNRPAYYFLFMTIIIYVIIKLIRDRNHLIKNNVKTIVPYAIVAVMPFAWYFVLSNHSYIHYWFTYRSLVICIISGLFFIEEFFEKNRSGEEK